MKELNKEEFKAVVKFRLPITNAVEFSTNERGQNGFDTRLLTQVSRLTKIEGNIFCLC